MGLTISDPTTADILFQLNSRFGAGQPLREMVTIQKEFKIFSDTHSLKQAYRILHIVPADFQERRRWFFFLEKLKDYISDRDGVSGHDRIRSAYQENLESKTPLPMHTTTHSANKDRRVRILRGQPIIYEKQTYMMVSIPTIPTKTGQKKREAAKKKSKK